MKDRCEIVTYKPVTSGAASNIWNNGFKTLTDGTVTLDQVIIMK